MLLLMRREGEAVRIKEDIILEIKKISEDEVAFEIQGATQEDIKLINTETKIEM